MECLEKSAFADFGSIYFIGWVVSSFILPTMADKFGRKPIVLTGSLLLSCTLLVMLWSTSRVVTEAMLFFSGFGHVGNCVVGYAYMSENLHSKHLKIGASFMFAFEGLSLFVPVIYYTYIGKDWKTLYEFALVLSII